MISVSVPAKIHLMGEHAVVYGKPALFSAINLRLTLILTPEKQRTPLSPSLQKLQKIIEQEIKKKFSIKSLPTYAVTINSQIQPGSGLGSSAAISAALTAALLTLLKKSYDPQLIFEIAYEGERHFHGNPSGGDLAAVIQGGLLWFRKEHEQLKFFSPVPFSIHKNIKQFLLIDSGKPVESTKEMVEMVRVKYQESRIKVSKIFDSQEEITRLLLTTLQEGDEQKLIHLIRAGEKNLEALGVVGNKSKQIIRSIEKIGGAAKILGGGGLKAGSGMILAYHPQPSELLLLTKTKGWKTHAIHLEKNGLQQNQL